MIFRNVKNEIVRWRVWNEKGNIKTEAASLTIGFAMLLLVYIKFAKKTIYSLSFAQKLCYSYNFALDVLEYSYQNTSHDFISERQKYFGS